MTSDQVIALFDSLELGYASISGNPGYPEIWYFEEKIAGILAEIPTRVGGVGHIILGLIMDPEEYRAQTGTPFDWTTAKPPPYSVTIPNVASLRIRNQREEDHK